ncbi:MULTISPECIES: fructose-2,6-bisphosphatase [Pseudomonas]|uniref:fructose-2,6-bisphosphatase n=1 Tax=Pseudomonas TaxID=286 RepID=UPI00249C9700|nr:MULTISPECIES: fructose-2,6-bisphosphatase [Pseudomonas]
MQITLVRHGRPNYSGAERCTPREMKTWIEGYNRAPVVCSEVPQSLIDQAKRTEVFACSSISRCVESRTRIAGGCTDEVDEVFAEAHLPYPDWNAPKLPVKVWRILFRGAWFLGFARHTESIRVSRKRARMAADRLIELARIHGSVMLVGHGIMNVLISAELRKRGWSGPLNLILKDYWQPCVYRKAR